MPYTELLLGAGNSRQKGLALPGRESWENLITLDIDPNSRPDVLHDLNSNHMPFSDNSFDEIHAYEVLEHIGRQGDWRGFFAEFSEYWRILKPDGILAGSCPSLESRWLWGDPGHTRAISQETLIFLSQRQYAAQVGKTPMTDYRAVYKADFELVHSQMDGERYFFMLKAIK